MYQQKKRQWDHVSQMEKLESEKDYAEKNSESTHLQIQPQQLVGEHQISMECVALDYFKNSNIFLDAK